MAARFLVLVAFAVISVSGQSTTPQDGDGGLQDYPVINDFLVDGGKVLTSFIDGVDQFFNFDSPIQALADDVAADTKGFVDTAIETIDDIEKTLNKASNNNGTIGGYSVQSLENNIQAEVDNATNTIVSNFNDLIQENFPQDATTPSQG